MQTHIVNLEYTPEKTFMTQAAADSVGIDLSKSITHRLEIDVKIPKKWSVGVVCGSSGSGKTTLARQIFGVNPVSFNENIPLIESFDESLSYSQRRDLLIACGLSSIPCWIKPARILSNGQRARAEIAQALSQDKDLVVIDEFTSVIDRPAAAAISRSLAKYMKKNSSKRIVLITCHLDVLDWIAPQWVIDCDAQRFFVPKKKRKNSSISRSERLKKRRGKCLSSITI